MLVAGPGVCSSDYGSFPFKALRRPIYPLDPGLDWDAAWLTLKSAALTDEATRKDLQAQIA